MRKPSQIPSDPPRRSLQIPTFCFVVYYAFFYVPCTTQTYYSVKSLTTHAERGRCSLISDFSTQEDPKSKSKNDPRTYRSDYLTGNTFFYSTDSTSTSTALQSKCGKYIKQNNHFYTNSTVESLHQSKCEDFQMEPKLGARLYSSVSWDFRSLFSFQQTATLLIKGSNNFTTY